MQPFTKKVIEVIQSIPEGKVMTYGQIADAAGSPRGARQVVRILHTMSRAHNLPWHRVVNIRGEIALQDEEGRWSQAASLESEGVEVGLKGTVDLERYRHVPEPEQF
ncbi:MGMT family protein [Paenibacillus soyae]|uniref:MGMT family protein n=1 Tax=Paenibacillus soyae TaxID=2969249 RepID=A0A9X2SCL3_9BACL|nr:MGMT family protein [Paenibacillus soyae]MCR2806903.1 MGMT family protein [Paenibacillus soyae]